MGNAGRFTTGLPKLFRSIKHTQGPLYFAGFARLAVFRKASISKHSR